MFAKGDDCPYRFVAWNERKLGHAPLVVEHGEVGMTDSAMADLNLDFFRPKCTRVEVKRFKRGMRCEGGVSLELSGHRIVRVPSIDQMRMRPIGRNYFPRGRLSTSSFAVSR